MKRRHFLQYGALATTGFTFAACSKGVNQAKPVAFGQPEKKSITIGFLPNIDSLPLVVAQNKGFFKEQGLTVTLTPFATWDALQEALTKGKVDLAATLFALPLWSRVAQDKVPLVALMGLNMNSGSIGMGKKSWDGGLRPSPKFNYRREFGEMYNTYLRARKDKEPPIFAINHPAAINNYLVRYWLSAMQVAPDRRFKFQVVAEKDLRSGLQADKIQGYALEEAVSHKLVQDKQGFTTYVDRDIWQGHPDKILATTADWAKQNPITTKAAIASVLAACQFCDLERLRKEEEKTPITLAQQLVKPEYLANGDSKTLKKLLTGRYQYDNLDAKPHSPEMKDFVVFHHVDDVNYLRDNNHANYLWQSHAMWVLTQMVRWNQLNLYEYPAKADDWVQAAYGMEAYRDVAKAVGLTVPKDNVRQEVASRFIDRLPFDPSNPVDYINNFDIRTS
jgi:nitrate/nitrite transport system substrate-binding protein